MTELHPTSTRRLSADESRARLIEAAADLLRERPPAEVSVREIAAAAGVNHGLVHRLFGGKTGLVRAVLRRVYRQTGAAIDARLDDDLEDALVQGLEVLQRERWIVDVMAHVMLTERSAEGLPRAGMMPLVRARLGASGEDADVAAVVAVGEAAVLGWLLFEPLVARGTGLDQRPPAERARAIARVLADQFGSLLREAHSPDRPVQKM
ncbi:MAG: TetR/AcrR family transcriptional regulator [Alphaproteobacteria bacterium]|nr:TetR/AcrR family transcriptional regulator [Alphaproteobacteria bacterium]